MQDITQKHKMVMPEFIQPELATLVTSIPAKGNYLFEIKYDGYRLLTIIKNHEIILKTRNNHDWSKKFPQLIQALKKLSLKNAILDGEIVVLDKNGVSKFELLQNAIEAKNSSIINYYVFDLLYYDGYYLGDLPLSKRRQTLKKLLQKSHYRKSLVQFSDNLTGNIAQIFKRLCKKKYEGIIAKNQDSIYQSRRTKDWLKIKCTKKQEFIIGGYTDPRGSRDLFGALLLGFIKNKKLVYCGKVGTGFNSLTLRKVFSCLQNYDQAKSSFAKAPAGKNIHWVKPKLVAEIAFEDWTSDGYLRQPVFQGLRLDKDASKIIKETPHG